MLDCSIMDYQQFYPHSNLTKSIATYPPQSSLPLPLSVHTHQLHRLSPSVPSAPIVPPSLLRGTPSPTAPLAAPGAPMRSGRGPKANGKEPNAPDKPVTPYMRYARENWETVKTQNLEAKLADVSRILGGMWRELDKKSKQGYFDKYEEEKRMYSVNLKAYRETDEYHEFQRNKLAEAERLKETAKNKGKLSRDMKEDPRGSGLQVLEEPDDEPDESAVNKQIAFQRYNRNHRLMSLLFNENVVSHAGLPPCSKENLEQVQGKCSELESHMKKLEADIEELQRENQRKKARLEQEDEEFQQKLRDIESGVLPVRDTEPIQINLKTLHSESKHHTYFEL